MQKKSERITVIIPSQLEELTTIEKLSNDIARKMGLSEDQHDNLSIAVTEAVGNAIVHGNKKDPKKEVRIHVEIKNDRVSVAVTDQGKGFDPDDLADPIDPNNLLRESGRGIFILKALMDEVSWDFGPGGTTLRFTLRKKSTKK